mgnify:CR=1 FL=1
MSVPPPPKTLGRVLYHHRTQGKGVEGVHIRSVIDALRAEGVKVDILSLPGADPYATPKAMSPTAQARPWMKGVAYLPEPLFELAETAYNLVAGWRVWRILRAQPGIELIYERYALFMFSTVLVARLRRVPIILEINDSATVDRVRPLFFVSLAKAIERWTFAKASGLVFVSAAFRDRVSEALGTEIAPTIISHNAANIAQFSFTPRQREDTRAKYGLSNSDIVCGYLGAFAPWHFIDKFVYRVADQLALNPHLKLLLVGDGATFPDVQRFVEERGLGQQVLLAGRVPHDQVPSLLSAMDMAVLPNAGDYTSPVKLFEFMACGIAPIAPDFSPITEVLREDQTGWMFPNGNLDDAVDMVIAKSRNPSDLRRVGLAARDYIATERQWRNNILQLMELYSDIKLPHAGKNQAATTAAK